MSGRASDGRAQSVKQRLLNLSKARGETFHMLLMRYGVERLLYRLSRTTHADSFVLKGAMLFAIWAEKPHRPTQDVDLLGLGAPSTERLERVFREVCAAAVEPDGMTFDPVSVAARPIREDSVYDGIRLNILATLGKARVPLQVDVGFGDIITPEPRVLAFGPLLDFPAPLLRTYPPETVIAEKLDAMLVRGLSNSRMKDYFDLWTLSATMRFDGSLLASAVRATISRRETVLVPDTPVGLSDSFASDAMKQAQWSAFLRKMGGSGSPDLGAVVSRLQAFPIPLIDAVRTGEPAPDHWSPGGPWI